MTEALTREAIKRLEAIRTNPREAGKPFYLYMAHYALHSPLDERAYDKRFADAYKTRRTATSGPGRRSIIPG